MGTLFKSNGPFRLLVMYQIFSGLGGGIFSMFMLLSVHLIYGNPVYTGIAGFLMTAPFIFSFMVGPMVDRNNKVTIMRLTTLLEFAVLALLTFTPLLENLGVVFMFNVIFVYSIAALFESPAGSALLPQIVGEEEILPANSLMRIASLAGGIVLALFLSGVLRDVGGDTMRLIFGMSAGFLALAFFFALLLRDPSVKEKPAGATRHNYRADLLAGVKFLRGNVLRFIMVAFIVRSLVAQMAAVNMPAFVEYHAGARGYIILSVMGMFGGILASSVMTALGKRFKVGQILFTLFLLAGVTRILFAYVLPNDFRAALFITVIFIAILNACGILYGSLEQKLPAKNMVGRIGTLTTTFFSLFVAVGALAGGFVGRVVADTAHVFVIQGIIYAVLGVYFLLIPAVRKLPKIDDLSRAEDAANTPF